MKKVRTVVLKDTQLNENSFEVVEENLKEESGKVLVEVLYFGLNAGMKSRIGKERDGAGTLNAGDIPTSDAVVRVIDKNSKYFGKIALIQWCPWKNFCFVSEDDIIVLPDYDPVLFVTALGHTAFTAWVSLKLSGLKANEHILVSGASGGVGISLIQWAKLINAEISAISSGKRAKLIKEELDVRVIDRKKADSFPVHDVYHDGIGGEMLKKSIDSIRCGGRIIICGNLTGEFPHNLNRIIHKDIILRGFSVINHSSKREEFFKECLPAVLSGKVKPIYNETVGIENMGKAFINLSKDKDTIGRNIVKI